LVSGEKVEARLPYHDPFMIENYAKLIFNCNELPRDVEHSHAYFRRFLIIAFNVIIPEDEQDKQLAAKIIENELSGVFNWVLEGLKRLLSQKRFTDSDTVKQQLEQYKKQSDSVHLFIEDQCYKASPKEYKLIKELYVEYRSYCSDDGMSPVKKINFNKRLQESGFIIEKKNIGNVVFLEKQYEPF
jgi:putative DNA primase/helicase